MAPPADSTESHQGPRIPSAGKPAGQGKGTGASPTHGVVARPKTTITMAMQGQGFDSGDAILHGDHGNGGVRRQPHEEVPEQDR
jgi:hypothetical protein